MPPRPKITWYRELPPKIRLLQPAERPDTPVQYLHELDETIESASRSASPSAPDDIAGQVFGNQLAQQAARSYQLAHLVTERRRLGYQHLRDINEHIHKLGYRVPPRPRGPGAYATGQISEVERQIMDLERQQRQVQRQLWRDLLDNRQHLAEARRDYHTVKARVNYLGGGDHASG